MEILRKWMTIMAIAGTILVTAVFCYMPVRKIIRENNKKTISLEQEDTLGDTEDRLKDLTENMTNVSEIEEERERVTGVVFEVRSKEEKLQISLWQSREGICYVFLPGFAKEGSLQVNSIEGSGHITIGDQVLRSGDIIEDIRWEEAYEFAFYNKENEQILSAPLIFIYSSDLPVLSLATDSGSMDWINKEKGNEEPGETRLFDADGQILYQGKAAGISGRGNSTWGLAKKPYQFRLKEEADLFGFGKAKGWNLLADGYDETKLRNRIALGLARELGMPYTPEGQSVDLYCNGIYYGIYYLCEKVEIGEERVEITDMEAKFSAVYNDAEIQKLKLTESEDGLRKWTDCQVEEADITGGYLFEREIPLRFEEEISGFITDQGDAYALHSPKYATQEQVNYIADRMQAFQDAAEEKDGINKATGKHYSEYIDVESFVRKYLIEEITKNFDGAVTSSFFYKPSDSASSKIYAGPVWDYDVAFGNCNLDEIVSDPMGITMLNDHVLGTEVFYNLYQKEDFYRQAVAMYEDKAIPYLEGLLDGGIDELSEQIRQAVKLDSIRWEENENRYQYYESYDNNIRYLKYFIDARMKFLNDVWLNGVEYHIVTFMVDEAPWKRLYIKDGETAGREPIPTRTSSLFMEWRTKDHDVPYDEYKPVYEDMVFYALWEDFDL